MSAESSVSSIAEGWSRVRKLSTWSYEYLPADARAAVLSVRLAALHKPLPLAGPGLARHLPVRFASQSSPPQDAQVIRLHFSARPRSNTHSHRFACSPSTTSKPLPRYALVLHVIPSYEPDHRVYERHVRRWLRFFKSCLRFSTIQHDASTAAASPAAPRELASFFQKAPMNPLARLRAIPTYK